MTLRRRMAGQLAATILSLLLISAAALWGLNGLHQNLGLALQGYRDLRQVYEVGFHVAAARMLLESNPPQTQQAADRVRSALALAQVAGDPAAALPAISGLPARGDLLDALRQLDAALADPSAADPSAALLPANRALNQLARLSAQIRQSIEAAEQAAQSRRHATMLALAILAAAVTLAAIVLGLRQYRSVTGPLRRLGQGTRQIAAGRFDQRLAADGDAELAALAEDFNRMAGQLDGLYRDLEQKVAAKSKELVRSERLASVGYLAAGVAHEINNPLGIITGEAELTLRQLSRAPDAPAIEEARKALKVICEEAFRCKEITSKLLSLARPGQEERHPICLAEVAREVISLVGVLQPYRNRRLELACPGCEQARVLASEGQMKQVLLNLTLNALEAVEDERGQVEIQIARQGQWVELSVRDNGRGMTPETLERVFEPFFTDKRADRPPGTGLGLSISHAIVESHGGRLLAFSDGPGRGSRFVVQLPAGPGEEP